MAQTFLKTVDDRKGFLSNYDNILLDCDGVLWAGEQLFPNIKETLESLQANGKRIFFISNNASKSREEFCKKFRRLGITVHKEQIYSSAFSAAAYLSAKDFSGNIYVIGMKGLHDELNDLLPNSKTFGLDDNQKVADMEQICGFVSQDGKPTGELAERNIKAVVSGLDLSFNMYKLAYASICLRYCPGCEFVATNEDPQLPFGSVLISGNGCLISALRTAVPENVPVVTGKPNPLLLQLLFQREGLDPSRSIMIGDRLTTDIAFGHKGGIKSLLVLTGHAKVEDLQTLEPSSELLPDFIMHSFGDFSDST
jgi:phosphoglycolate/pyridoxal phosphate phosphatase family enzyme